MGLHPSTDRIPRIVTCAMGTVTESSASDGGSWLRRDVGSDVPHGLRRGASLGLVVAAVVALILSTAASAETWRGLTVAPEHRCSPYERKRDYLYAQSVERDIVRQLGAVYGPYTGRCFGSAKQTDMEHTRNVRTAADSSVTKEGQGSMRSCLRCTRLPKLAGMVWVPSKWRAGLWASSRASLR